MSNFEHAFFYSSENHDRVYDATSFEYWIKKFFTTGVFTGELQVTANDDMTVTIGAGYINIGGKVKFYEETTEMILETAHSTYDRIDCVVIERNDTLRDFVAKIVTGRYSSDPIPATPVRENGIDQRVLAQVRVAHGAVRIIQADITDTRTDPELCGIVAGTVKEINFKQFQAQFDSYFAEFKAEIAREWGIQEEAFKKWFEHMRGQLSEDAAGHLQEEVDELTDNKLDKTGDSGDTTAAYTSDDEEKPQKWKDFALFTGIEKLKEFTTKVSTMASNLRWLYKMLGTTDISKLGDGTVTGALNLLNSNLTYTATTTAGLSKHSYIVDDGIIIRIGRIVIFSLNTNLSGTYPINQDVEIIYGLPKSSTNASVFAVFKHEDGTTRVKINSNGVLSVYLPDTVVSTHLSGQIVYVAAK